MKMAARAKQLSTEYNDGSMETPPLVKLHLSEMSDLLSICRLDANGEIPAWAIKSGFYSITRTTDELSIVCLAKHVPAGITFEAGWRGLKVEGPLDFNMVGILASLIEPLAQAAISIFALGTFDTDYLLIKEQQFAAAIRVLSAKGHAISRRKII